MLKEDYLMRLFQLFTECLAKWLSKRKDDDFELIVSFNNEVVEPYLGKDIEFFEKKELDELLVYFQETYPNEQVRLSRLEILAELLYQSVMLENDPARRKCLSDKALKVFQHIDKTDKTFSFSRQDRMAELRQF